MRVCRDSPNQYNSIYKYCNGSDRQDVVICALNPSVHSMVGDACPEGHFGVGMLTAIDNPLRESIARSFYGQQQQPGDYAALAIHFLGIVAFIDPLYPSVRMQSKILVSMSVREPGNTLATVYARLMDFQVRLYCLWPSYYSAHIHIFECWQGEIHLGTIRKDTDDLLGRQPRSSLLGPVVPYSMLLNYPGFQRSMFMNPSASFLYAFTVPDNKVYRLSMSSSTSSWEEVLSGSRLGPDLVQILACTSISSTQQGICAYTKGQGHEASMLLFSMNFANGRVPHDLTSYTGSWLTGGRTVFETEVVQVPGTDADLVVGAPVSEEHGVLLMVWASNRSFTPLPTGSSRGIGCFKSMAFTEDGLSLLAVDEQPGLWRWQRESMSSKSWWLKTVAHRIHPMANSVWKVMVWTNSRIVIGVEYSLNLWTQCSPCPEGTVTAAGVATGGIRERCLCSNGTYNDMVDFRRFLFFLFLFLFSWPPFLMYLTLVSCDAANAQHAREVPSSALGASTGRWPQIPSAMPRASDTTKAVPIASHRQTAPPNMCLPRERCAQGSTHST